MRCFRKCFSLLACLVTVAGVSIPQASGQLEPPVDLGSETLQAPEKPRNARDLAILRAYHDKTVWADEVLAQEHEQRVVALWDQLIKPLDKFRVLADVDFEEITVGVHPQTRELDWGIGLTTYEGSRTISGKDWPQVLSDYQQQGYEILETEWHHSEFRPPADGRPAQSVIAMVLHVIHREQNTRYAVRGDLEITWTSEKLGSPPMYQPTRIDARNIRVLHRQGQPAYEQQMVESFRTDPLGRFHPNTIHPVIIHDLNGDLLPEVVIAGYNRIYWNRGNWKFEQGNLCKHPSRLINTGVFADFTGDGALDFLCGVKNGYPRLYEGQPGGKFDTPPRGLRVSDEVLPIPVSMSAGDIDADGDLDVFIGQNKAGYQTGEIPTPYYDANDSFPSLLLVNDGSGNFTNVIRERGLAEKDRRRSYTASFVDLDDDGDLDLLLTNDFAGNDLFLNDGKGYFTDATHLMTPRSFAYGMSHTFGDYNLDGRLDFLTIGMSSTTARRLEKLQLGRNDFPEHNEHRMLMGYGNRMYLRTDEGFVQAPFVDQVARTGWSWGSTTLDFDRDGDPDIYVANGQLSGETTRDYCTRFWCHDLYYEAGNRPDEAIKEFFGRMGPIFSERAISWNGYEHNALLMNLDGEGFVNIGFLMNCGSEWDSRMALGSDLDLDGKVDLVFEHEDLRNGGSNVIFLRNQWEDDHHWVGVHLDSTKADPSPLGAKVIVNLPDGRKLLQHHVTGHEVWAQQPNTLHFGLGRHDRVGSIEVTWPGGEETVLESPEVDRYIRVSPSEGVEATATAP